MQETNLSKDDATITRIMIEEEPLSNRFGFTPDTEERETFFRLCSAVYQCGVAARSNQKMIHRSLKADGSILTETDLAVSDAILDTLSKLYPDCNIVTEEIDLHSFREGARYTFVLDPIDGTDAYSQGIAAWAVSLGILDSKRKPCGAIVFAPRFGVGTEELFFCSVPNEPEVFLNGELHKAPEHYAMPRQLTLGSDLHKSIELSNYNGKFRGFCSSIIHLIAPIAFSNIDGCINNYCYVWDIAGAHGLLLKLGMDVNYFDGKPVEYDDCILIERKKIRLPVMCGTAECMENMLKLFPLKG